MVTCLQEVPMFAIRLIIILNNGVFVHSTCTFFFLKNLLMTLANVYKLTNIYNLHVKEENVSNNEIKNHTAVSMLNFDQDKAKF